MPRPLEYEAVQTRFSIKLPPSMREPLEQLAQKRGQSVGKVIRSLIADGLRTQ